jgi:geranylgeranyl diphosphate synthase, type II
MISFYKELIDTKLTELLPKDSPFFPSLYAGGRYVLFGLGKRIRPLLTLLAAEMLKPESIQEALIPACALELVHTYSLIHDDLPCMDDDDFRRGLPTLHKVYSEGHAVLIGDYLLTYAFELLADAPLLTAEQKISLVGTLSRFAGGEGMIGGQMMDIENSPQIEQMHALKTAALFRAALGFGGIIAGATPHLLKLLDTFAIEFGKLFQIIDDLIDGDHPLGRAQAESTAQTLYHQVTHTLTLFPGNSSHLHSLTHSLFTPAAVQISY